MKKQILLTLLCYTFLNLTHAQTIENTLNKKVDAEWFFMEGKHHANARIAEMTPVEKARLIAALEKWLSIKIN